MYLERAAEISVDQPSARRRAAYPARVVEYPYSRDVIAYIQAVVYGIQEQGPGIAARGVVRDDSAGKDVSVRLARAVEHAYRRAVPDVKAVVRRIECEAADVGRETGVVEHAADSAVDHDGSRTGVRIDEGADHGMRGVCSERLAPRSAGRHASASASIPAAPATTCGKAKQRRQHHGSCKESESTHPDSPLCNNSADGHNPASIPLTVRAAAPFRAVRKVQDFDADSRRARARLLQKREGPSAPGPEVRLACIRIGLRLDGFRPVGDARRRPPSPEARAPVPSDLLHIVVELDRVPCRVEHVGAVVDPRGERARDLDEFPAA